MVTALRVHQFGPDGLRLDEVPLVEPGPHEVLVRVHRAALNYVDLLVVNGTFNPSLPLPHVPGSDVAGVVERVGSEVRDVKEGDAVISTFIRAWLSGSPTANVLPYALRPGLGMGAPGLFASHVLLPADGLVLKPSGMSFDLASTLPIAGLTAWNGLKYAALEPGQTLLLYGTGGVSLFALVFARMRGLRVVVVGTSARKLEHAKALGASLTVDRTRNRGWKQEVLAATGGEGADAVFDVVGGETLDDSIALVKPRGRIVFCGLLDGFRASFATGTFLFKQAQIIAMEVGSRADFLALLQALDASGYPEALQRVIDVVVPARDARDAFKRLAAREHVGKIVLSFEDVGTP